MPDHQAAHIEVFAARILLLHRRGDRILRILVCQFREKARKIASDRSVTGFSPCSLATLILQGHMRACESCFHYVLGGWRKVCNLYHRLIGRAPAAPKQSTGDRYARFHGADPQYMALSGAA